MTESNAWIRLPAFHLSSLLYPGGIIIIWIIRFWPHKGEEKRDADWLYFDRERETEKKAVLDQISAWQVVAESAQWVRQKRRWKFSTIFKNVDVFLFLHASCKGSGIFRLNPHNIFKSISFLSVFFFPFAARTTISSSSVSRQQPLTRWTEDPGISFETLPLTYSSRMTKKKNPFCLSIATNIASRQDDILNVSHRRMWNALKQACQPREWNINWNYG